MSILRSFDRLYLAFQSAAKSFGFLSAAEAGIRTESIAGSRVVRFGPDADTGWPAAEIRVPGDSVYVHAVRGFLLRAAVFRSERDADAVADFFREELGRLGGEPRVRERRDSVTIEGAGGAAGIRARIGRRDPLVFSVAQQRARSDLRVPTEARRSVAEPG